jgi:hypothetical protein
MDSLAWLTQQTVALRPAWTLMHVAVMAWGLMMVIQARQPLWVEQAGRTVWARVRPLVSAPGGVLVAGGLWALMPCGLLYSALLVAALSGGPLEGALSMALFGLGSGVWLVDSAESRGQCETCGLGNAHRRRFAVRRGQLGTLDGPDLQTVVVVPLASSSPIRKLRCDGVREAS